MNILKENKKINNNKIIEDKNIKIKISRKEGLIKKAN